MMAALSGCLLWLHSCSPLPTHCEQCTKSGLHSPSSSCNLLHISPVPLLLGVWVFSWVLWVCQELGLPRMAVFPPCPSPHTPYQWHQCHCCGCDPVCALWSGCLWSILPREDQAVKQGV